MDMVKNVWRAELKEEDRLEFQDNMIRKCDRDMAELDINRDDIHDRKN